VGDWKTWRRIDSGVAQPPPGGPDSRVRVSSRRQLAALPPAPSPLAPAAWLLRLLLDPAAKQAAGQRIWWSRRFGGWWMCLDPVFFPKHF
jgi:hypothetical protein